MSDRETSCAEIGDDLTTARAASIYDALRRVRPATRADLKNYLKVFLGIDVPDMRICEEHQSPMDYLWHCFSIDCGSRIAD